MGNEETGLRNIAVLRDLTLKNLQSLAEKKVIGKACKERMFSRITHHFPVDALHSKQYQELLEVIAQLSKILCDYH